MPDHKLLKLSPRRAELFNEMLDSSLREDGSEPWQNFDPPFRRSTIRPLEISNVIETRVEDDYVSHRFKPGGRERAQITIWTAAYRPTQETPHAD